MLYAHGMVTHLYTIKHDEHGPLGIDSFMVRSAFKLVVRVYGHSAHINSTKEN